MEVDTDPLEGSSYNVGVSVKAEIKMEHEDDHYNTIRRVNRVSWGQLEKLWEFVNTHRSIASGVNRTLKAKEFSRIKWRGIADSLNAERDGVYKDWTWWAKYWGDYKNKLKKRAAALRASRATGEKPYTEICFNEIEKKFLILLREDIGEGLPDVQAEQPPQIGAASTHVDVHDSSASESVLFDPGVFNSTQNPPSEPILELLPQTHADSTHMYMHDSSASKPIILDSTVLNPPLEPILESLPQTSAASTHLYMHDSSASKPIILDSTVLNPPLEPILEPLPQTSAASTHLYMHDSSASKPIILDYTIFPLEPILDPLSQTHTASTHVYMHDSSASESIFLHTVLNPTQNPPLEPILEQLPQTHAAPTHVYMHDSSASESILHDPTVLNPPLEPILEPLPQTPPVEPLVQDPPAPSPSRPTPRHATPPAARSRFRRRRRVPPLSQQAASRALVRSTQMHAEAAVRIAEALEKMVQTSTAIGNTASRIERALLELAQCVQTNQEPIEFNSTDAMMDPKTGLMICLHCLEDFDSNLLSDHMINAHNYRRVLFKCHVCQNTFQERKLLMIHRQECQPEPKVRKRKSFQQIMREVESKYFVEEQEDLLEPVACPICLLELPKYCLKEHLLNEHRKPDVILTCGRCNRNFKSKLTLREHVKLVHEAIEDSEECELCGQKFRSLKYLSNHKRNVHPSGNKIHKCTVCGKEFKSRLCLHQHSKYVHPPESASVECPHCPNKMFKSRINLTQHLKVSHGWKKK